MKGKDIDTAEAVVGWIREVLPFLPGEEYKALEIELPDLVLLEAYITALEAVAEAARTLRGETCQRDIADGAWADCDDCKDIEEELYNTCQALATLDQGEG